MLFIPGANSEKWFVCLSRTGRPGGHDQAVVAGVAPVAPEAGLSRVTVRTARSMCQ